MINLGLAGPAGCGKSTVADYLVSRYGFVKYAFSDALYREVSEAFGLEDESLLRDRKTKEVPSERLALVNCKQNEDGIQFVSVADELVNKAYPKADGCIYDFHVSPRQVLQWWGTEYRRAQDPDYWVNKAAEWLWSTQEGYPEQRSQLFVNDTVRFENERDWIIIDECGAGNIWHIHRDGLEPVNAHESENPLPVLPGERELWNNDTLARLHYGIDLLMTTSARFVRVEPMEKEG